ncbi:YdiK family protein [Virgibacillus sp. NKC19-16]|uniref:YdiK family protein n=1 Tax=Virgibacillus salidurans TaxID=2831673 RepID=UPI001F2C3B8F|nr:YdiK family protein [Virgibacillus sp. NKC19-16]UJL47120.1 YdiK family protein [Virgibacillus sp. NKC19-16]
MGMAIIYFAMGIGFIYLATQFGDSTWDFTTIIFALVATLDFGVGFRMLSDHFRAKKKK